LIYIFLILQQGDIAVLKPFQIFTCLLFLTFSVFSQVNPAPTPKPGVVADDDDVIKINSRLVVVPVTVTDTAGQPVTGLKVTDFNLWEENKQQQLEQLSPAEEVPLEIALLIDISSSVDPLFESEKQAAAKFLKDVMRPIDRASIFTVGTRPFLLQPRDTSDKVAERLTSINLQKAATAFYDSVILASDYLRRNAPPASRKVIVVISDGDDSNSDVVRNIMNKSALMDPNKAVKMTDKQNTDTAMKIRAEAREQVKGQIMRTMQNADVVFYSINPAGNSYQLNIPSVFGQETMKIFADQTGGTAFLLKKPEDMDPIFRRLISELRAQYLLQYYTDADFPAGKYVNLKVSLVNKPQAKLRARQGYFVKKD
jgi:Ca-activated chloride channel family protein